MPLSAQQIKYLAVAWACFETEPKIDYEKFRELAGLKTARSARELMRVTKKKLHEEYGAGNKSITSPIKKPATPKDKDNSIINKKTGVSEKRTANDLDDDSSDTIKQEPGLDPESDDGMHDFV